MVHERLPDLNTSWASATGPTGAGNAHLNEIEAEIAADRAPIVDGSSLVVPTDCLYFDNAGVTVRVSVGPRGERITVSDDGNAPDRIVASGRRVVAIERTAGRIARKHGLAASGGVLVSSPLEVADVAAYIGIVANASRELADALREMSLPRVSRDLTAEMIERLDGWFPGIATRRNAEVPGTSHKLHRFDLEATIDHDEILLIDEIRPKRVNTILAAGFDVGRRSDLNFSLWAVYDPADAAGIGAPNFSLLGSVVRTVSIDEVSASMLRRIA